MFAQCIVRLRDHQKWEDDEDYGELSLLRRPPCGAMVSPLLMQVWTSDQNLANEREF